MTTKAHIAELAIAKATAHIGDEESPRGSNSGPQVDRFLAYVHLGPGFSWCMAFIAFCYGTSAESAGAHLADTGLLPTASCQAQAEHARKIGTLVSAHDAAQSLLPGWVMLKWEPELNRYAHTGIVTAYDPKSGIFKTIEGNTNTDGGREGYIVARQKRGIADLAGGRAKYAFINTTG